MAGQRVTDREPVDSEADGVTIVRQESDITDQAREQSLFCTCEQIANGHVLENWCGHWEQQGTRVVADGSATHAVVFASDLQSTQQVSCLEVIDVDRWRVPDVHRTEHAESTVARYLRAPMFFRFRVEPKGVSDLRGTFNVNANLVIQTGSVTQRGRYTNSGTITVDGGDLEISNIANFENTGDIASVNGNLTLWGSGGSDSVFHNSGTLDVGGGGLTIQELENTNNSGLIHVTGGNAFVNLGIATDPRQFTNTGDIEVGVGRTFSFWMRTGGNSTITMGAGATMDGGGQISITRAHLVLNGAYSPNDSDLSLITVDVGGAGSLINQPGSTIRIAGCAISTPLTNLGAAGNPGTVQVVSSSRFYKPMTNEAYAFLRLERRTQGTAFRVAGRGYAQA